MSFNQPSLIILSAGIISLALSLYALSKRNIILKSSLFYIMAAATIWSFAYGFELALTKIAHMKLMNMFAYLGISSISVFWLIFAIRYTGNGNWLTRRNVFMLLFIPCTVIIMVATNDFHHLYYTQVLLGNSNDLYFQQLTPGPYYWVHLSYSYLAVIAGIIIMLRKFSKVSLSDRINIGLFVTAVSIPFIVSAFYIAGFKPYGFLDTTPIGFIFMGIILTIGVFSVNLFNITPLALDVLFDNIQDAIFVLNKNDQIVSANPAARKLLKSGKTDIYNLDNPEIKKLPPGIFSQHLSENNEFIINDLIYLKTNNKLASSKGIDLGTLITLRDITENKENEKTILQINKNLEKQKIELQQLNADKDRFLQIISHDLRNPVNALMGLSELMIENLDSYDKEQIYRLLKVINDTSVNTFNLLEDLLLWSKAQTGKLPFEPEELNLSELAARVISHLSMQASQKQLQIISKIHEPLIILGDRRMLRTILRNLISNAIKFTNADGSITVSTEKSMEAVTIIVSDTGVGISASDQKKLWNQSKPFTTVGTAKEKGTGMGLLLCRDFVEKHGGNIWVESEPGKGTDFKFTIPVPERSRRAGIAREQN